MFFYLINDVYLKKMKQLKPIYIFKLNSLPQVIYQHILTSLNTAVLLSYICQTLCDSN